MRRMFFAIALCYTISACLFCWFILSYGKADWLRVESPSVVYRGQCFPVQVTLLKPVPGFFLTADLHWMDGAGVSHGYLAGEGPVRIIDRETVYNLTIPVTPVKEAVSVFAVICLSRDGTWGTRVQAASLDPVPVVCSGNIVPDPLISAKTARIIENSSMVLYPESVKLRFVVAGVWFIIAVSVMAGRRRSQSEWIAAAALASSVWEAFNGSMISANLLRNISWFTDTYNNRLLPQQFITLSVVLGISLLLFRYILESGNAVNSVLCICLTLFWGISFLHVISFHATDIIFSKKVAGIGTGQLARIAVSLAGLAVISVSVIVSRCRGRNSS